MLCVEFEIELEHVDASLAEEAEGSRFGVRIDELANLRFRHPAFAGYAWNLKVCCCWGDVRIKAGRRRRDEVDRNGRSRVFRARRIDVRLDGINQLLVRQTRHIPSH